MRLTILLGNACIYGMRLAGCRCRLLTRSRPVCSSDAAVSFCILHGRACKHTAVTFLRMLDRQQSSLQVDVTGLKHSKDYYYQFEVKTRKHIVRSDKGHFRLPPPKGAPQLARESLSHRSGLRLGSQLFIIAPIVPARLECQMSCAITAR